MEQVFKKLLNRPADSNKYAFGHVLVIGGSPGMVGAPFLAARAALRIGAGLVTIGSSPNVIDKLERRVEEIMTLRLQPRSEIKTIEESIKDRRVNALVIGPGFSDNSAPLVRQIIKKINLPTVVDGGALLALAGHLDLVRRNSILTPHLGEFRKLTGQAWSKESDLEQVAKDFTEQHKTTLILKGNPTYVGHPDGKVYINKTGNPGLATAGTGDILAGIIGGMLAQGLKTGQTSEAAVYIHGLAGDLATADKTEAGVIASDVIDYLPRALKTQVSMLL